MRYIVCKFGGTSVASKEKIEQIFNILQQNTQRKCIILSAPGKAPGVNTKVTDLLIGISKKSISNTSVTKEVNIVKKRYFDIYQPLGVGPDTISGICSILDERLTTDKTNPAKHRDAIAASGEEMNARLFAEFLKIKGIKAEYISPEQAGLIVTPTFGDARCEDETTDNLTQLKKLCENQVVIFPGFFGVTKNNEIATFSRGGSDFTGALCAEAIDAAEYENWTDVDGIFSANPEYITSPEQIPAMTYKEMRELSVMGFKVFHEEAVRPVMHKKIPIRLRNTNNIENEGTLIVAERLPSERDVIGIASGGRFCSFNLQKFLMNREIGFGRKLLSIFEEMELSFEHCPSGVDNLSVLLDQNQLGPETVNNILRAIEENLKPDEIKTEFGIALVAVVGEGLLHKVGVLGQSASALARAKVNIKVVNQGSSEISMIFGIDASDEKQAVNALYDEFFK